jgi:uncharacterized repeat protein (TIGR03833 family)
MPTTKTDTIAKKQFSTRMHINHKRQEQRMQPNQQRSQIKPGSHVKIVLKQDQRSGKLTEGTVKEILTNSPTHPHGIKVRLMDGKVGRVQTIMPQQN